MCYWDLRANHLPLAVPVGHTGRGVAQAVRRDPARPFSRFRDCSTEVSSSPLGSIRARDEPSDVGFTVGIRAHRKLRSRNVLNFLGILTRVTPQPRSRSFAGPTSIHRSSPPPRIGKVLMVYVMLGALSGAGFASVLHELSLTAYLSIASALVIGIYFTWSLIQVVRPRRIRRFRRDTTLRSD